MSARRRAAAAVALGAAVLGVPAALWGASQASVSPEQRAADAEPPPEPRVTAELEHRRLEETVVFRGVVRAVSEQDVPPPTGEAADPVVVDLPLALGDPVEAGDVLAVVADRPIIAVPMDVPLHRSLEPGAEGEDVARLQTALDDLGHDTADAAEGAFDAATQEAVTSLYDAAGFPAPRTDPEADDALDAAEERRRSAAEAVEDATTALERQEAELDRRRSALAEARDDRDDARAAVAEAEEALEQARDEADEGVEDEDPDDEDGDGQPDPPSEDPVAAAERDLADAEDRLAAADEVADSAEQAVADAQQVIEDAERDLGRARRALAAAVDERDEAAAAVGVRVPSGELFAPSALPAVVSSVDAEIGDTAEGPLLSITPSRFVIEATVNRSLAELLPPGTAASAGEEGLAVEVASNDEAAGDGDRLVELRPEEPLDLDALGRDVRVEAVIDATDEAVPAVPVTALRSDGDGAYIEVVDGDEERRVGVTTGASIGGWAEIVDAEHDLDAVEEVVVP